MVRGRAQSHSLTTPLLKQDLDSGFFIALFEKSVTYAPVKYRSQPTMSGHGGFFYKKPAKML